MSRTKCSFSCSNVFHLAPLASVVPSQCLWGQLQNPSLLNVSKQAVMSFCVAGVALRGIPTCFKTRQKSCCVAGAILLLHFQKMCWIFRGRRSILDTSDLILRARRSTLDVSCCVFLRIALSALRKVVTRCKFCGRSGILSQVMKNDARVHIDFEVGRHSTPHFTPYTRFRLSTFHSALYTTLGLNPQTLHSTLYTLHSTLRPFPHFSLCTLHFTLHILHSPRTPHFTLCTQHFTLHTLYCTLFYFTLCTLHHTLYTPHPPLYTLHSTLYTLHSTC